MKRTLLILSFALIAALPCSANEADTAETSFGLGTGALIGGILAGPPGALFGAVSGSWFGAKAADKNEQIAQLSSQLTKSEARRQTLLAQIDTIQTNHRLVKATAEQRFRPEDGTVMAIFFKNNSVQLEQELKPGLLRLAKILRQYPAVPINLEGHADVRGDAEDNRTLSYRRIQSVKQFLIDAGLNADRIRGQAYGESRARGNIKDRGTQIFDRRVTITLDPHGISA